MKHFPLSRWTKLTASVLVLSHLASMAEAQIAPPANAPIAWGLAPNEVANRTVRITRGQIVPRIEPTANGVRITVDTYEVSPGQEVIDFYLQIVLRESQQVTHEVLKFENPISTRAFGNGREIVYELTHAQLEEAFRNKFPNAPQVRPDPGTPLFVYAKWPQANHEWGGPNRGGSIVMPGRPGAASSAVEVSRPRGLDVAVDISAAMRSRFQDPNHPEGLKEGGQIRSRIEGEGKYQIALEDVTEIKRRMFELARNPQMAQQVFGAGWTLKIEDRYMRRDASGNLILGADGFPIPDPMVDTYYDNARLDAAANDMANRYRWTEGNRTGSWNFKPGDSRVTPDGIMYRIEYGVDTTSDQPGAIRRFADSFDPLNPYLIIREKAPNALPSEFFEPSVRVVDHRYKFKLEHASSLAIEISLDEVTAQNLRTAGRREARFAQLELDIDHLATVSTTKIGPSFNTVMGAVFFGRQVPAPAPAPHVTSEAVILGGVALHNRTDLAATSPILVAHSADFSMAARAITSLRQRLLGVGWRIAPQKYALSARELDMLPASRSSPSVRAMVRRDRSVMTPSATRAATLCKEIFKRN